MILISLLSRKNGLELLLIRHVSVNCYHRAIKFRMFLGLLVNSAGGFGNIYKSSIDLRIISYSGDSDFATFERMNCNVVINSYSLPTHVRGHMLDVVITQDSENTVPMVEVNFLCVVMCAAV